MRQVDPARLIACLFDVERHVSSLGWDQPTRLFALVPTGELLEAEPLLRGRLPEGSPDSLSAVEQDEFVAGEDLKERLEGITWPASVEGCAIALERSFLPREREAEIPGDATEGARFVAAHPERMDVRVVVGVLRDGSRHGLARLVSNPDELLGAEDLVPGLTEALARTLESDA